MPSDKQPKPEQISKPVTYPERPGEAVAPDFYFNIMSKIFETIGNAPLAKMASNLCSELGIPHGPTSALTRNNPGFEIGSDKYEKAKENDRIIGTVFANIPGVYVGIGKNVIQETAPIVTMDINKILDVLEDNEENIRIKFEAFLSALPKEDRDIILGERELRNKKKQFGENDDMYKTNYPLIYSRLPGGIGVFLRGYIHNKEWEKNFCTELTGIYANNSSVILIEGYSNSPLGESLAELWKYNFVNYGILMRGIAKNNNKVLFGEIDGRNTSKVLMDNKNTKNFVDLPTEFYENYYAYIQKINPDLLKEIEDPETLKIILGLQSTSFNGIFSKQFKIKNHDLNTGFTTYPSMDTEGRASPHMTGLELGQAIYSDALSCVKLHLLANLSSDGHLPSLPIVDFQGSAHLDGKTFFIQNPQYALMVVLMNIHELMAGEIKESWYKFFKKNSKTAVQYSNDIFLNPNWKDIIEEILKLPIKKIEQDPNKTVTPGNNQKELVDDSPDFARIYGLDVTKIAESLKREFENKK